jgi:hypothetical protein
MRLVIQRVANSIAEMLVIGGHTRTRLQLRSAIRTRAGILGQYAAIGRIDHRRVEDERHLAYR